jgi:hypothetical protein
MSPTSPASPVWSGIVSNLSAGGLQVRCPLETARSLEVGDIVGMRLLFGVGEDAVYIDGQFRHLAVDGGEKLLGFQFLGLGHTRERQNALRRISMKVSEYQRAARRQPVEKR